MSLSIDGFWKAGFWAQTFWADGFWQEGAVQPQPEVVSEVIRNFKLREKEDDRYDWLRMPRPEDAPAPEPEVAQQERAEIVETSTQIGLNLQQAISQRDEMAELRSRLALEAAKKAYLSTYEKVYRDTVKDELLLQWRNAVAAFERSLLIKRRAALLLLLAN